MKILSLLSFIVIIGLVASCSEKSVTEKAGTDSSGGSAKVTDEVTQLGEIPGSLTEGLSEEEKNELKKQIFPSELEDPDAIEKKFKALVESAKTGDAAAQNNLGVMYYTGEAISKNASGKILNNDPELAAGWFYRAAEQGYADAQFNLGLMYINGEGVEKDMNQAVALFKKAAEQGHVDAQNNLGAMYFTGEGVDRDEKEAIKWFEQAAKQGNADAQANLDAIKANKN